MNALECKHRTRVLVFPCGAENAIEIHNALRYSLHVELFGASSVDDHGRFKFENYVGDLPHIQALDFDDRFQKLLNDFNIDMVFPTHDTVAEYLAPRAKAMGVFLVNGDPTATYTARRKSATYRTFADRPWVPRVYEELTGVTDWPVVIKPDFGQGGQGVVVAHGLDQAKRAVETMECPVVTEFLPGAELTIDCFTDRKRKLLFVGPRSRERVRAGISMRCRLLAADEQIGRIAAEINERLPLRGPWFFQLKQDRQGGWKLLEVSCRVAGAMVAQRARGVNLPLMAVQDYLGRDLVALEEPRVKLIERCIATRAELDFDFDSVYVDLDDTLIIDGHAVPQVLAFLYQSRRDGKRLVLITRHAQDVHSTLAAACIAPELFIETIHIRDGRCKSHYVKPRSIFIDNHFPERLAVASRHGVPVLDVDALEFFIR